LLKKTIIGQWFAIGPMLITGMPWSYHGIWDSEKSYKTYSVHRGYHWAFFSNRVVIRWNLLDQWTVDASSLNAFKNRLGYL